MARIFLIEDDPDQRELRATLLEMKGHQVVNDENEANLVLMDLRIPTAAAGRRRIRDLHSRQPAPKIVVLSGAVGEIRGTEEEQMVDSILEKPCPSSLILKTITSLLLLTQLLFSQVPDYKAHAPILYQREDTVGTENDIPLVMYCEWDSGERSLTYTVIFSNEDGGTSTRDLMARWGRTTDIEYVYKVWFKPDGGVQKRQVQGKDHKDIDFAGPFEGQRPVLEPVTRNNMVAGAKLRRGQRFDFIPTLVDLSEHSREHVMDLHPETWKVMREELMREKKIRPYGVVRGEDIGDPLDYVYAEFRSQQVEGGRIAVGCRLKGSDRLGMSHLGKTSNSVERSGWMRLATELPPGTRLTDVEAVAFACYGKGSCRLEQGNFLELRGERRSLVLASPVVIPAGEIWFMPLK